MELAIPGVALGLMYIMNGQSNRGNDDEEPFTSRNELPNTNIPNRNFPEEYPIRTQTLDQTSALSTVNQLDNGGSVYTDKYFDANMASKKSTNDNETASYYSLTGEKVSGSHFEHNNMVPFFGAKMTTSDANDKSYEGILDNYSGAGSQTITKKEQAPMFSPNENQDWAHGAPNMNDFYQSRVNNSMRMANTKPFEEERVAPGLGLGYTNEGANGFNSGMMMRETWQPKDVDHLRVDTKPKSSGHVLLGHEGPAYSNIQQIGTSEQMGVMEKNRPETAFEMGQDRLFTTTGASKGETLHAIPIDRYVSRPETTTSYSGAAGSQNPATYAPG